MLKGAGPEIYIYHDPPTTIVFSLRHSYDKIANILGLSKVRVRKFRDFTLSLSH